MLIGTAGHVNHGKTSLVRALTGIDTDRLPEERRRGLSIDLGFAYLETPSGRIIGFVDVPGHDRYLHNMISHRSPPALFGFSFMLWPSISPISCGQSRCL